MGTVLEAVGNLCDRDLLMRVQSAVSEERQATVELIAVLAEIDTRRLYLEQSCSSLFTFCTEVLHLSEHAAYTRIEAARTARRFPVVLDHLADGSLHLTAVRLLAPHLTTANHIELMDAVRHKSKREVEQFIASLHPQPDVRPLVRKLPERQVVSPQSPQSLRTTELNEAPTSSPSNISALRGSAGDTKPLAPERYKIQFTVGRDAHDRLRRVRDLLRHTIPNGDLAAIFERALVALERDLSNRKLGATTRPRVGRAAANGSRHIPAAVKRAVWQRDQGRCAFRGTRGRCSETGFLEFHHVVPFADGGDTTAANLELRCRAHNNYEAERWFGPRQTTLLRESRVVYLTE